VTNSDIPVLDFIIIPSNIFEHFLLKEAKSRVTQWSLKKFFYIWSFVV
jgi:hypothetical protein